MTDPEERDPEERDPDLDRPRLPPRQPYRPPPVPRDHPQATTVLVLGILGLVLCGLLAPFACYMGNNALRDIDANPSIFGGRGLVSAGRICGIVGTCLLVFGCCCVGLVYGLGGTGA